MTEERRRWRRHATDVASAAFLPLVVFITLPIDVVLANSRELGFQPAFVRTVAAVALVTWVGGWWVVTRFRGRFAARLLVTGPWALLLLDVTGSALDAGGVSLSAAALADIAVIALVLVAARLLPWSGIQSVAALSALAFMAQGAHAQAAFFGRALEPTVAATASTTNVPVPEPGAPGNVYHILFDNYQSESYGALAASDPAARFPGFTNFTRFNTQFPRTASSELALIHGRRPAAGLSIAKWSAIALSDGFWHDLASAHVGLWIYPYGRWLCPAAAACVTSEDVEREAQAAVQRDAAIDLWALRLIPASVRRVLRGSAPGERPADTVGFSLTGTIRSVLHARGSREMHAVASVSSSPGQSFNLKQFDSLLADEARRPPRGQYVYYHALIPHPDYLLNERCEPQLRTDTGDAYWRFARCANLMVHRLVDELARLRRLDDALIIVHADHGDMQFVLNAGFFGKSISFALDPGARNYQVADTAYEDAVAFTTLEDGDSAKWRSIAVEIFSSGLLLVKFPHASVFSEDQRPIDLLDLAPTILAHFGRPTTAYAGVPIPQVPPARDRIFYAHSRAFDGKLSQYRLTPRGWEFVEDVPLAP